jgi:hypothetical protein
MDVCENTAPEENIPTCLYHNIVYDDNGILKEGQAYYIEGLGWYDVRDKIDFNGVSPVVAWYKVPKYSK